MSQSEDSRRQAPNLEIGYFQLSAALGELFREMWLFSWCTSPCPSIKQDQDDQYSGAVLETGRKVRNCQILTIFDHLSILMHLSIT